ncbi:hypothetical protein TSUD_390380 [Trifolium subterraneum]|uniref:Uncharacterized protein n=1 Tax=Trifolium subterraneum TaxID=3900 RepID=A0A2Z6NYD4_TRISU|nr:hypothetical protein TSUD_390380 [Trifolium subterraneum]
MTTVVQICSLCNLVGLLVEAVDGGCGRGLLYMATIGKDDHHLPTTKVAYASQFFHSSTNSACCENDGKETIVDGGQMRKEKVDNN